jgi:MFS family permease
MALATAPWHVLAVRVTDRIGKGIRSSPRDVLIAAAAPPGQVGRAFGFHRAMDHAGAIIGPLVATLLLSLGIAVRDVFWLAAIPGILAVICVLFVREDKPTTTLTNVSSEGAKLPRPLLQYLGILFVFALGNSSDAFLLYRAQDLGVSVQWLPILWVTLHIVKFASAYVGGSLSDRVPRARLIIVGWLIYAVVYLALGLATQAFHVWAIFIVYGLYYGLTEPSEKALIKDLSTTRISGRAFGFYNFTLGVSAVLASLITGGIWQAFGALSALAVGAGFGAFSALLLALWAKRHAELLSPSVCRQPN